MRQIDFGAFLWEMDAAAAEVFADMVQILADAGHPGHQYLEVSDPRAISVIASAGEYPADLKP
jgi:hypothetical protein